MKPLIIALLLAGSAAASDDMGAEGFYTDLDYLGPAYFIGKPWFEEVMLKEKSLPETVKPEVDVFGGRCGSDMAFVECLYLKILLD